MDTSFHYDHFRVCDEAMMMELVSDWINRDKSPTRDELQKVWTVKRPEVETESDAYKLLQLCEWIVDYLRYCYIQLTEDYKTELHSAEKELPRLVASEDNRTEQCKQAIKRMKEILTKASPRSFRALTKLVFLSNFETHDNRLEAHVCKNSLECNESETNWLSLYGLFRRLTHSQKEAFYLLLAATHAYEDLPFNALLRKHLTSLSREDLRSVFQWTYKRYPKHVLDARTAIGMQSPRLLSSQTAPAGITPAIVEAQVSQV